MHRPRGRRSRHADCVLRPPSAPAADAPPLLFVHGGGWVEGNLDTAGVDLGRIYGPAGCVVVTPECRFAAEHAFPAALDDVIDAYEWFLAELGAVGVDPARIAVAVRAAFGESPG